MGKSLSAHYSDRKMKYGHFDDAKREYVIERPDTPLPWIN